MKAAGGSICPWCGGNIKYFSDEDNSNYNEYICEYYNAVSPFTGQKCWWRASSGVKAITREEWEEKRAEIAIARNRANAMITEGKQILSDIEHGRLKTGQGNST